MSLWFAQTCRRHSTMSCKVWWYQQPPEALLAHAPFGSALCLGCRRHTVFEVQRVTAGSEGLQLLVLMKNLVCQRYASRRGHAATHPRSPKARTCCCTSWMRFSSCFCRRTARASASDARSASARAAFSSCSRRSWSLNACESCAAPDDARFSASSTRACMCLQRCGKVGWRQCTHTAANTA